VFCIILFGNYCLPISCHYFLKHTIISVKLGQVISKCKPKLKYTLTISLTISLAVTQGTCMYNLGSLQINYTLNDVKPTHTHKHTHTVWKAERQQRCNQQNYTKIQSKKKNERRNKFDTNASTRMTQKRQQPKNPHRPSNGSPLP